MSSNAGDLPKSQGLASRVKASSPLGTAIFLGLRSADVALQYNMFHAGWGVRFIQYLGGATVPQTSPRYLGLAPYPAILTAMAVGSSLKHCLWVTTISEQEMQPFAASVIGVVGSINNTLNALLSIWAFTSMAPTVASAESILDVCSASPMVSLGIGVYSLGLITELLSEIQRKRFKENPANAGKPYGGGLFSLATNINYGGFTLWRSGYAIAAAGLPWGLFSAGFFAYDFATRAIPELDDYCTQREDWKIVRYRHWRVRIVLATTVPRRKRRIIHRLKERLPAILIRHAASSIVEIRTRIVAEAVQGVNVINHPTVTFIAPLEEAVTAGAAATHTAIVPPVDRVDSQIGSDRSGPGASLRLRVDPGGGRISPDCHASDVARKDQVEDGWSCHGAGDGEQKERERIHLQQVHIQGNNPVEGSVGVASLGYILF
ncbi:hypothetical protein MMC07_007487 [Pseudocyphellaria aurata]|nr:hypothetical protein [Pseudocyphellaria aurata]